MGQLWTPPPIVAPADRWRPEGDGFMYDADAAERPVRFMRKLCVHTKGIYARKPFEPAEWQAEGIVRPTFGELKWDDVLKRWIRRYRIVWIELGRKNGKSEIMAALALFLLMADAEESAEIYSAAKDRYQAAKVFDVAKRMVELSPLLSKHLTVIDSRKRIIHSATGSYYEVIAADAGGNLGSNPHGIFFDEILTQPNGELWDALKTGMGTRVQPLMVAATTAGTGDAAFCRDEHDFAVRVESQPQLDPTAMVFLRNLPDDADWRDERNWHYPNPALGDFLRKDDLSAEAVKAAEFPAKQNAFRQFRLNQWVASSIRWVDMALWDAEGNSDPFDEEDLHGQRAYGGLDLASTNDFAAWQMLIRKDQGYYVLSRIWTTRRAIESNKKNRSNLLVWAESGHLRVVDRPTIDYDAIEAQIGQDAEDFDIRRFGYDPWNAGSVVNHLEDGGLIAVKVPQTTARLNDPTKEIERALASHQFDHGGHPVLAWMANNTETEMDAQGNRKPSRSKSPDKIDGIAASANAAFVALMPDDDAVPGVYSLEDYLDDEEDF